MHVGAIAHPLSGISQERQFLFVQTETDRQTGKDSELEYLRSYGPPEVNLHLYSPSLAHGLRATRCYSAGRNHHLPPDAARTSRYYRSHLDTVVTHALGRDDFRSRCTRQVTISTQCTIHPVGPVQPREHRHCADSARAGTAPSERSALTLRCESRTSRRQRPCASH